MAGIEVKVTSNTIAKIIDRVRNRPGEITRQRAERIAERARSRVHVVTGELRDSIKARPDGKNGATVVAEAEHASFEEFGTRYRPPHPFLTPAAEAERGGFVEDMKGLLR